MFSYNNDYLKNAISLEFDMANDNCYGCVGYHLLDSAIMIIVTELVIIIIP